MKNLKFNESGIKAVYVAERGDIKTAKWKLIWSNPFVKIWGRIETCLN